MPLIVLGVAGSSYPADAVGDAWSAAEPMPTPRRLLAAAAMDGKIYTFGGCGSPCFHPTLHPSTAEETLVEVFDSNAEPGTDPWTTLNAIPTIFFGGAAASPGNGKIYLAGGFLTGNVLQEYDPVADSWTLKPPMPTSRYGLALVALDGKLYAMGGSGPSNALERYDPATDTWTSLAPMPTARVYLAAAAAQGKLYAIGGSPDAEGNSQTDAVEIYDPVAGSWTARAPLPEARQVSAAASLNGKLYVFGGLVPGSDARNTVFEYDPNDDVWTPRADMPTARDQAPAAVIDGRAYVVGGSVDCHCQALPNNESYVPPGVPQIDLAISKTNDLGDVRVGEPISYSITVTHAEEDSQDANGAVVSDDFPDELSDVTWSCPDCSPPAGTGAIDCTVDLAAGATLSCTATGLLASDATGQVCNTATVSSSGLFVDPDESNNSDTQCNQILPPPPSADLAVTKSSGFTEVVPCTEPEISYTVTVRNNGPDPVEGARVRDAVPPGLMDVTWICVDRSGSGSLDVLVNLPPGGQLTCEVTATVAADATGSLTNTATVVPPSGVDDPIWSNDSDSHTILLRQEADLAISKSNGVDEVIVCEPVTYTVTVRNLGPCPVEEAPVWDTFPPELGLDPLHDTVSLLPGQEAVFVVTGTLAEDTVGSRLVNTATVTPPFGVTDPDLENNEATDDDPIVNPVVITISKTNGVDEVFACEDVTYTIEVTNGGPCTVEGTVSDTFPPELPGVPPIDEPIVLSPGGTDTRTATGTVAADAGAHLVNTATFEPLGADPESDTDSDPILRRSADITVTKTNFLDKVTAGEVVAYTITVTNGGPEDAKGVRFEDEFPDSLSGVTWMCPGCSPPPGTAPGTGPIDCMVDLVVGDVMTCMAKGTLADDAMGELCNTATASPSGCFVDPDGASATDCDPIRTLADLVVTKSDGVDWVTIGHDGDVEVTYTIEVKNEGPKDAVGAVVADDLPDELTGIVWTCGGCSPLAGPDPFACTVSLAAGGSLLCTASGTLPLAMFAIGELCNTVTVSASDHFLDPDESNNAATDCDEVRFPDCNTNGVHDSIDITGGFSDDISMDWIPDECQTGAVDWLFTGTAEGGTVELTIEGFFATCTVGIATLAGESAATVVANLAAALNADACLTAQDITATAMGPSLWVSGFLLSPARVSHEITDPGLGHKMPIWKIPTLSPWGLGLMIALLSAAAVLVIASRRRYHRW